MSLLYLACCALVLVLPGRLARAVPRAIAAILVLLPVAFFLPAFLGLGTPAPVDHCASLPPWSCLPHPVARNANMNDVARQTLPWAQAVREAWRGGTFPWRDRWNGCGTPLSANGSSAAYAPWTLVSILLPAAQALVFVGALKLFLALIGGWLWLRELQLSTESALFGAILIGFCLSMSLWLFWPQSAVIALWPWSLFLIECQMENQDRRTWWALTIVFALWPLAGHLETAASGAVLLALWLAARSVFERRRIARSAPRIAAAAAAAAGLAAFSLLPQLLAILASDRLALSSPTLWRPLLSAAPHGPRWPQVFLTTIFPRSLGDQIAAPLLPGAPASFPELALGSVGLVGWCLAAHLLFSKRGPPGGPDERRAAALVVPIGVALATASLTWPFGELASLVPGLRYMLPLRLLSCAAVAAAALAAFGLERIVRAEAPRAAYRLLIPTGALVMAALSCYAMLARRQAAIGGLDSQRHALLLGEAVLLGLFAWILLRATRRVPRALFSFGVCALAAAELFFQGGRFYRYEDPRLLYPATPLIDYLRLAPRPFRVLGEGSAFYPNSNVFAGIEEIRVHDPSERRDYVEFLDRTCGYDPRPYFKEVAEHDAPVLDFLNVKYLVTAADRREPTSRWTPVYRGMDGAVFENRNVLPRVFSPRTLVWVPGRSNQRWHSRNAVRDFGAAFDRLGHLSDWKETALVLGRSSTRVANPPVDILEYEDNAGRISFRAVAAQPAILVASIVQDGGWTARLAQGPRLPTYLANGPFLAVGLPAGEHRVVLSYTEPGFVLGACIAALTAGILAACGLIHARQRDPLKSPKEI